MKTVLFVTASLGLVWTSVGQNTLADFDWSTLGGNGQLRGGIVMKADGKTVLRIVNTNESPLRAPILVIQHPAVTRNLYAIVGDLKYEGVRGDGYLEMWNYFPPLKPGMPEGAYFSRTLGQSGEMGKLVGTSDWRRFMLPFDRTGATGPPDRLEVSLFLPAQGTVYLGPAKLVEYNGNLAAQLKSSRSAWWPDTVGGVIGGVGGAVVGTLAGLLGWLASRGRSRAFVLTTLKVLVALGLGSAVAGVIALAMQQPYGVWFVLLLFGVLLLAICPFRLAYYSKVYESIELRKMASQDV